ncbi:hypothetical protein R3P38DRAFT_2775385 [Favolaschia claudopus]|uniref:Uncharacterized protein n=1 Tax=Favolaschia claudopus TaxID=2862362 RepID=A0AAW0BRX3_9AGAR
MGDAVSRLTTSILQGQRGWREVDAIRWRVRRRRRLRGRNWGDAKDPHFAGPESMAVNGAIDGRIRATAFSLTVPSEMRIRVTVDGLNGCAIDAIVYTSVATVVNGLPNGETQKGGLSDKVDERRGGESSVHTRTYVRRSGSRLLLGGDGIPSESGTSGFIKTILRGASSRQGAVLVVVYNVLALPLDFDDTGKCLPSANARTGLRFQT